MLHIQCCFPVKHEVHPRKIDDISLKVKANVDDITLAMEHVDLLDRGLVKEICPSILAVETQVENGGKKYLQNVFLDQEDKTGGLSTIADPDKFVNFSATLE